MVGEITNDWSAVAFSTNLVWLLDTDKYQNRSCTKWKSTVCKPDRNRSEGFDGKLEFSIFYRIVHYTPYGLHYQSSIDIRYLYLNQDDSKINIIAHIFIIHASTKKIILRIWTSFTSCLVLGVAMEGIWLWLIYEREKRVDNVYIFFIYSKTPIHAFIMWHYLASYTIFCNDTVYSIYWLSLL